MDVRTLVLLFMELIGIQEKLAQSIGGGLPSNLHTGSEIK